MGWVGSSDRSSSTSSRPDVSDVRLSGSALLIVISGPGGVGKGTLVERLVARDPRLWLSRSWTTRARRPGERADAYHFVGRADFERRIAAGGFLEWAEFLGHHYGTPTPEPPPGADAVLEIDVQGARQVMAVDPSALLLFVDAPTRDDQRARLLGRGDPPGHVERRLARADEERAAAAALGMRMVINDDIGRAVTEVESIIAAARNAQTGGA